MKISYILFLLATFLLLLSCKKEKTYEDNFYVGTYRFYDTNVPNPTLIDIKNDTLYYFDYKKNVMDRSKHSIKNIKTGDTISMQKHMFLSVKFHSDLALAQIGDNAIYSKDTATQHQTNWKDIYFFMRLQKTPVWQKEEIENQIQNHRFTTTLKTTLNPNTDLNIQKTLHFTKDSVNTTYSYFYNDSLLYAETQTKKYHIIENKGSLFISENETENNPQILYQITDRNKESFEIQYYQEGVKIVENFKLVNTQNVLENVVSYENCLDGRPGEYYHDNIKYSKGLEYVLNKVSKNAPEATGNGYIILHFTVNCNGDVGRLGLEQMDRSYKTTSFSTPLVAHIVTEVTKLKEWPDIPPGYFYKDIHAFFMFKIENGKITDLCP